MLKPITVLIVDDDAINLKLLTYSLNHAGYTTQEARNGAQALASVADRPPDLILLDVMMPIMDGFEALARLKESPQTRDIPVLILTALSDDATMERARSLGAAGLLTKPIIRTELLRLAAELVKTAQDAA